MHPRLSATPCCGLESPGVASLACMAVRTMVMYTVADANKADLPML